MVEQSVSSEPSMQLAPPNCAPSHMNRELVSARSRTARSYSGCVATYASEAGGGGAEGGEGGGGGGSGGSGEGGGRDGAGEGAAGGSGFAGGGGSSGDGGSGDGCSGGGGDGGVAGGDMGRPGGGAGRANVAYAAQEREPIIGTKTATAINSGLQRTVRTCCCLSGGPS